MNQEIQSANKVDEIHVSVCRLCWPGLREIADSDGLRNTRLFAILRLIIEK